MLRCIVRWPKSSRQFQLIEMSGRQIVLSEDCKAGYRPQDRMVSMSIKFLILLYLVGNQSDQKDENRDGQTIGPWSEILLDLTRFW